MNEARDARVPTKRGRRQVDPHELGYRFYRGYIYRRMHTGERCNLWNPAGRFICSLSLRLLPRYVDKSIRFEWHKDSTPESGSRGACQQLSLL